MQLKITIRLFFLTLAIWVLNPIGAAAQTFEEARNYAFDGEREKARELCRKILSEDFNSDVALLLGRTYAWDGMYDSARVVFHSVLHHNPDNFEVLGALADVEYWSDNHSKAIEYCDKALQKEPDSEEFVLKKARILNSDEKTEEAVGLLSDFVENESASPELMKKLKEYRLDLMRNTVKIAYTVDFFEEDFNRDPWHIVALSYGHETGIGSVIARVNYAKRFDNTGFQYEIDAYPTLTKNAYAYVNYGFSESILFPNHRLGFEWYQNFPKAYEASLGLRALFFDNSSVDIYTATVGKYLGNYWLSLRSYVTPDSDGTSVSGSLQMRRYYSDPEHYYGVRLSYGISPDDNSNLIISEERLTLKARSLKLEYNHIFKRIWILNLGFTVGDEERIPGKYSNFYTFDIIFSRLF